MLATMTPPSVTLDPAPPSTPSLSILTDVPRSASTTSAYPASPYRPTPHPDVEIDERGRTHFPQFPTLPNATRALSPSPSRALSPNRARNSHTRSSSVTLGRTRRRANTLTNNGGIVPNVVSLGIVGEEGKEGVKESEEGVTGSGAIGLGEGAKEGEFDMAYYRKLEEERDMLRMQLEESQQQEKDSFAANKSLKNQLALRQSELDDARRERATLEVSVNSLQKEGDSLKRELRLALKERTELTEKVTKERAEIEGLKAQFEEKERNWVEQVRAGRRRNRDLQSQTIIMENGQLKDPNAPPTLPLPTAPTSTLPSANSSIPTSAPANIPTDVKDLLHAKDKEIHFLNDQISHLSKLNTLLSTHLSTSQTENANLKAATHELQATNARLMEEAESYQLLLEEKTLNGDFLEGAFMTRTAAGWADDEDEDVKERIGREKKKGKKGRGRQRGMSLSMEFEKAKRSGSELEDVEEGDETEGTTEESAVEVSEVEEGRGVRELKEEISALETRLKATSDELKAVNLYISKILAKLLTDDIIEAALVEKVPDDERPATPPVRHSDRASMLLAVRQRIKRKSYSVSLSGLGMGGVMGGAFLETTRKREVEVGEQAEGEKKEGEGEKEAAGAGLWPFNMTLKRSSFPSSKTEEGAEGGEGDTTAPVEAVQEAAKEVAKGRWRSLSIFGGERPEGEKKEGEEGEGAVDETSEEGKTPPTQTSGAWFPFLKGTGSPSAAPASEGEGAAAPENPDELHNVDLADENAKEPAADATSTYAATEGQEGYFTLTRLFVPRRGRSATFAGSSPPSIDTINAASETTPPVTASTPGGSLMSPGSAYAYSRFSFFSAKPSSTEKAEETDDKEGEEKEKEDGQQTSPSQFTLRGFFSSRSGSPSENDVTSTPEADQPSEPTISTSAIGRFFSLPRRSPPAPVEEAKEEVIDEQGFVVPQEVAPLEMEPVEGRAKKDDTIEALKSEILSDITDVLDGVGEEKEGEKTA
ncbi:hypothetical protein HDV00_012105 [Rhizophlyctis rosea]|nr:hypothetical protein HDV00_012105 [Rhizophlyctis rosea]